MHGNLQEQLDAFVTKRIKEKLADERYISDSKILIDYIHTNHEFKTDTIKVGVFLEDNFIIEWDILCFLIFNILYLLHNFFMFTSSFDIDQYINIIAYFKLFFYRSHLKTLGFFFLF